MDKDDEADGVSIPSYHSFSIDMTEHNKKGKGKKQSRSITKTYLETAAFWYRMAIGVFCTSIGRFDKTSDPDQQKDVIDVTLHPTYQQLLLRLGQVISDHYKTDKDKHIETSKTYLGSTGVGESILRHFDSKKAMKDSQWLSDHDNDSLSRLQTSKDNMIRAQEGFRTALAIEEAAWGADHQIVVMMRQGLHKVNRLRDILEQEILDFPAEQAQKEKDQQKLEQEKRQKDQQGKGKRRQRPKSPSGSVAGLQQPLKWLEEQAKNSEKERSRADVPSKTGEEFVNVEIVSTPPKKSRQKKSKHKPQRQTPQKQNAPSGSIAGIDRPSSNGIETLRRLQDQVYQYQKQLAERDAEKDQLKDQFQSKTGDVLQTMAAEAQKEEAAKLKQVCEKFQNDREAFLKRIKQLENQIARGEQKHGQLEFTMRKEGADLAQSATQKEIELEYWKQKFALAQTEWHESQARLEEQLQKTRIDAETREAELVEWRDKFENIDGEWKTNQSEVVRLQRENERLQQEVTSCVAERKQLEFSNEMRDLEFAQSRDQLAQSREQQVFEARKEAARSESEAAAWKRKYDVAQKEWLSIQNRADEQAREAIADATNKTAELERWKKKFEIAQKQWIECQTRAESQARGAIATAKRYEVSHADLTERLTAAQNELKSLLDKNNELEKQTLHSQSKQDQLEFSLKKQAIDYAKFQETLNRKTAEAQVWKDQCQASQQAQKLIAHEMQLSRANDGSLQDRIADLRQQNLDLKERNRELQADQESKKLVLEARSKEIALVKQAALKRIRQLKDERKQLRKESNSVVSKSEIKDQKSGAALSEYDNSIDLSDPSALAAKLGRTQRALEYVEKDHKDSLEEIESLTKAKNEVEGNFVDAQKIISLLKTANNERIEQCVKLESEKDQIQRQFDEFRAQKEGGTHLRPELDNSIADKESLEQVGEPHLEKKTEELDHRFSKLESDLRKSELRYEEMLSIADKYKLQSISTNSPADGNEEIKSLSDRREALEKQEYHDMIVQDHKRVLLTSNAESADEDSKGLNANRDKEQIESLLKRCENLERDLVAANQKVEDLEDTVHDMSEREGNAEKKEKEFKRRIDVSTRQIKSLRNSVRDLSKLNLGPSPNVEKSAFHLTVVEDLEQELEESNEIRENLSSELRMCKEKIARAEQKEKEFQWLTDEYSQLEDKLEESNQIREEMSSTLNSLKKRLARAEEKEDEADIFESKLLDLERELEESCDQNRRLQSQIENLTSTGGSEDEQRQYLVDQISNLEKELGDSAKEIKSLKKDSDKLKNVSEDLEDLEEENEELLERYRKLEKAYLVIKQQAEQNSKSLARTLEVETKEQERVREEYTKLEMEAEEKSKRIEELESRVDEMRKRDVNYVKLEKDLEEKSKRNKELKSRIDEMRKRNIDNLKLEKDFENMSKRNIELESTVEEMRVRNIARLSDHSTTKCQQCLVLGDELRSMIEQNEKHVESTEKFQDNHDRLLNRFEFLEKELNEAIEQNEILEAKLVAKESNPRDEELDNDDKYQELNVRCIELEEQLRDSNDLNDKKAVQLEAMRTKVADLEAYADDTAADLEQAESIIGALKAGGADKGAEVTLLLDRCNKLQQQLKESQKTNEMMANELEGSQRENILMKEELDENMDGLVVNIDMEGKKVEELNEKLTTVTNEKDKLETLLKKAEEECEQQKRLKGHVEKDRDYLDKMYNECKTNMAKVQSELDETKELLKKADDEKEELERQLQIEKHVSQSLRTSMKKQDEDETEENELEELYRQARDELTEVEGMLFETEEELEALKAKYKKLEETSKLPSNERAESELSEDIKHDLHNLSRDELMVETRKALRKMQDTQFKVVDLQETNMILQAQLKSSLTFKEKQSRTPARRTNGGGGGFWSLGGGNGPRRNSTNEGGTKNGKNDEANNNDTTNRFFGWRGGARGGDAGNEKGGDDNAGS